MENRTLRRSLSIAISAAVLLTACAAEVQRQKTQWMPVTATPMVIELSEEVTLEPATGYSRTLSAGSQWREAGRIPQGMVFRPVTGVLTAEGKDIHEAFLVLDGSRVVGFYLPAEQAFSPLPPKSVNYQKRGN